MGLIYQKELPGNTKVGVWRIDESETDLLGRLQLSQAERAHIDQFKDTKRYLHWLGSRVLLRTMIDTDEFIELKTFSNQRPKLLNFPYHVSISHSHEMAAVAISPKNDLGIDIEWLHEKVLRVKHKFLHPTEISALNGLSNSKAIEQATIYWCVKEAMYKWYGKRGIRFASQLRVQQIYPGKHEADTALLDNSRKLTLPIFYEKINGYILAVGYAPPVT